MKITLQTVKDLVLVVAVLTIIGLILFKRSDTIVVYDHEESIRKIESLENKIDSMKYSVDLIIKHRENEKIIIDSIVGVDAHDSTFASKFGFSPSRQ